MTRFGLFLFAALACGMFAVLLAQEQVDEVPENQDVLRRASASSHKTVVYDGQLQFNRTVDGIIGRLRKKGQAAVTYCMQNNIQGCDKIYGWLHGNLTQINEQIDQLIVNVFYADPHID